MDPKYAFFTTNSISSVNNPASLNFASVNLVISVSLGNHADYNYSLHRNNTYFERKKSTEIDFFPKSKILKEKCKFFFAPKSPQNTSDRHFPRSLKQNFLGEDPQTTRYIALSPSGKKVHKIILVPPPRSESRYGPGGGGGYAGYAPPRIR